MAFYWIENKEIFWLIGWWGSGTIPGLMIPDVPTLGQLDVAHKTTLSIHLGD